jgi:hypothetical protein
MSERKPELFHNSGHRDRPPMTEENFPFALLIAIIIHALSSMVKQQYGKKVVFNPPHTLILA